MRVQDKVVEAIRKTVKDAGLEASEHWEWANMGSFHVTRPDSFEVLFTVSSSFQSGYLSGAIAYPGERVANSIPYKGDQEFRSRGFPHTEYVKAGQFQGFIDAIAREAARFSPDRRRGPSLDESYGEAMEYSGSVEVADTLLEFLKTQPQEVQEAARKVLEGLSNAPAPAP